LEIITGRDVVTQSHVLVDPVTGQRLFIPGLEATPFSVYFTLFSSMFMHGGIAHIAGNMLFLWIFGDNIEDRLGHIRYLIFYLLSGVIAPLAHVFATAMLASDQSSLLVPSLGASGAISGVLGAYILLYPARRVTVILFRFLSVVPAYVAHRDLVRLSIDQRAGTAGGGSQQGGVAYAQHTSADSLQDWF
jgi:membrane associated rhomboid family serine protease